MQHLVEHDRHHLHFFGRRELNSLYLTAALVSFAEGLSAIFVPIYLWERGYPLWQILFFYFLFSLAFVVFTFLCLPLLRRISDKTMMLAALPFSVLYFWGLDYLTLAPMLFYILPLVRAFDVMLFNVGYNLDFAGSADKKFVGEEVGARFALSGLMQFAAPFVGGILIALFGFGETFLFVGFVLMLAVVPLLHFPRRNRSPHLSGRRILGFLRNRSLRPFNLSGAGYATEKIAGLIIWPLIIFISVGGIEQFGAVMAFGVLVSALVAYGVGFLSDVGKRQRVITVTAIISAALWLVRPFAFRPVVAVGNHMLASVSFGALNVAWSSQYYKIARAVKHPEVFIVSREVLYNASRVIFLGVLMILAYFLALNTFFVVAGILTALVTITYILANRVHTKELDTYVLEGEAV
jgi:hypothetical protein